MLCVVALTTLTRYGVPVERLRYSFDLVLSEMRYQVSDARAPIVAKAACLQLGGSFVRTPPSWWRMTGDVY